MNFLFINSSLKAKEPSRSKAIDPTVYRIVTQRQAYYGSIIFHDDTIIKFRTEFQKPVKILKTNVRQIHMLKQAYNTATLFKTKPLLETTMSVHENFDFLMRSRG